MEKVVVIMQLLVPPVQHVHHCLSGGRCFCTGNSLSFFAHNGTISSVGGPRGITANYEYFSGLDNHQSTFSNDFFYYYSTATGRLGYKRIGEVGSVGTPISSPPVALSSITSYSLKGVDYIWGVDSSGLLHCVVLRFLFQLKLIQTFLHI